MIKLQIPESLLDQTIRLLKASTDREKVILWLGKSENDLYVVKEVFVPTQITEQDHFAIPPEGMQELMGKLRGSRMMLIAQVHTHPYEAYHSEADDKWAIVRHINAFSIVLPWFASSTTRMNFKKDAASFVLTQGNTWELVDNNNILSYEL